MNARSVTVPCDRCGQPPLADSAVAPFTFCSTCGLYVCGRCWVPSAQVCNVCATAADVPIGKPPATRPSSGGTRSATTARRAKARSRSTSSEPQSLTTLTARHAAEVAAKLAAPIEEAVAEPPDAAPRAPQAPAAPAPAAPAAETPAAPVRQSTLPALPAHAVQDADRHPVGPGIAVVEADAPPRWARRTGPVPVTVRGINVLTEGMAYRIALAVLMAVGISAAVWGITVTNEDETAASGQPSAPALSEDARPGSLPSASPPPTPTLGPERRYIVRDGDTLAAIAKQVYGDETLWTIILEANRDKIPDPERLRIGTDLVIPSP